MRPQPPDPPSPQAPGLGDYLKAAFTWRWNLLGLFAGGAFALLSPVAGAVLPLLAAAELIYLTGLVSAPKFRRAIDAKLMGRSPEWEEREEDPQTLLTRMLSDTSMASITVDRAQGSDTLATGRAAASSAGRVGCRRLGTRHRADAECCCVACIACCW